MYASSTNKSGFPTRPLAWLACRLPVIATARSFSKRVIFLGGGSGISIASLSMPGLVFCRRKWSCSAYRTCRGTCSLRSGREAARRRSSNDPPRSICRGSSSSASCSARSPVPPRYEKSEPAESEERRELLPCFSFSRSECSSDRRGGGIRLRRGILVAREGFEEGMVATIRGLTAALLAESAGWVWRDLVRSVCGMQPKGKGAGEDGPGLVG